MAYLVAWIGRRLGRRQEPRRSSLARWTRREVLTMAGGGIACVGWGWLFEPYRLEVTRTRIVSPKLRGAGRPIRLVHISDMHSDPKIRKRAAEIAKRIRTTVESLSGEGPPTTTPDNKQQQSPATPDKGSNAEN